MVISIDEWTWYPSRLLAAFLVGTLLSFSGSLIQLTTRNELATPSTLGMDGVAVLVVLISYFFNQQGVLYLAGLSILIVFLLAKFMLKLSHDLGLLIMLGMAVNILVGSFFALFQFISLAFNQEFPNQLWFGRIHQMHRQELFTIAVVVCSIFIYLWKYRSFWRSLLLGSSICRSFNIPERKILMFAISLSYLITVWVVIHFGVFSFIGLLCPFLLRQFQRYRGHPWRELTEGSFIPGVVLTLLDHCCFNWTILGAEVPVGLPLGLFGALALVILLIKRMKQSF